MKKNYLVMMLCLLPVFLVAGDYSVYEANYPGVKDYNVNIDEATLIVKPQGNFIEMNILMTVSYDFNSWFFKNYDELEFLWNFSLPEEAIMHDFAIWLDDSLVSATMLDKWTAELLFSEVSSPVRHPGLLTNSAANRDGQVSYQLKIFPLMRNQQKKFQIQYLVPARPSVDALRAWLPTTQLISSKTPGIDTLQVIYKYEDDATEPRIIGTEAQRKNHRPADSSWVMTLPLNYDQFAEILVPSPVEDAFFFSVFEQAGENYYHMAVNPPTVPETQEHRNLLVVIDFNRYNTDGLDGEYLLSYMKEITQQALTDQDSINVLVAYDALIWGANNWVACTEQNLDALFANVLKRAFPGYSNFQPLMVQAAEFINDSESDGEVVLFTNTDEIALNGFQIDQLAEDIVEMFKSGTKFHVMDLENKSRLYYNSQTGFYETQLQSFWGHITDATAGNLFFLRYHEIKSMLSALLYENVSHFERVEVQLEFASGYAHSTQLMALHEGYYPLNFPIMQVGKFDGTLPVDVQIFGKTRSDKVVKQFTITEADVTAGNEAVATSWYGDYIRTLLHFPYDPITVNDIITYSIEQSILTPYSGFIVLNPDDNRPQDDPDDPNDPGDNGNDGGENRGNDDTWTDGPATGVVEDQESTLALNLRAYPNPFTEKVNLQISMPQPYEADIHIFNVRGQKVKQLDIAAQVGTQTVIWDGTDEYGMKVSAGVYLIVLRTPVGVKIVKVMFMP